MNQFAKAKTAKNDENTSMSEEANVGLADEAIAIVSRGKKIESREKKGSVKT